MPPPPSTASSTGGTKPKKKKTKSGGTKKKKGLVLGGGSGGGGGIKIKPFARPPSLPVNFYETSVGTLLRALGCVLREEPLYVDDAAVADGTSGGQGRQPCASSPKSAADPAAAGSPAGDAADAAPMDLDDNATASLASNTTADYTTKQQRRPMSREELYRLVEDLVTHNYGPQLYGAVLEAMDEAALTCLRRMVNVAPGCVEVDAGAGGGGGASGNNKAVLFVPDGAAASAADPSGIAGADGNATASGAILAQIHAVCASYYEYLRCVRSVFLHLDRRFVFLPGVGGDWKR